MTQVHDNMKRISVIVPIISSMGRQHLFEQTIESILSQRGLSHLFDLELVIAGAFDNKKLQEYIFTLISSRKIKVQYIEKRFKNTASAVNKGIQSISYEYVSVINCGDTISKDFIISCLADFPDDLSIPFIASRSYNQNQNKEIKTKESVLNCERFGSQNIIILSDTPSYIHTSINAAVFRTEVLHNFALNEQLPYLSNVDFTMRILLHFGKYAVQKTTKYYFCVPQEDDYLYYTPLRHKDFYHTAVEQVLTPLLSQIKKQYNSVPAFIQFSAMYILQSIFLSNENNFNKKTMDKAELDKFLSHVQSLFFMIDDEIILNTNKSAVLTYTLETALMFLNIKHGQNNVSFDYREENDDICLYLNGIKTAKLSEQTINIHVMDYVDNKLNIDGSFERVFEEEQIKLYAIHNGGEYLLENNDRYSLTKFFGRGAYKKFTFHLELTLDSKRDRQDIRFAAEICGKRIDLPVFFIHHWAKLTNSPKNAYWRFNKYMAVYENNCIVITLPQKSYVLTREIKFMAELFSQSKLIFILRLLYWLTRPYFRKKRIWMMYDKFYKGGDSSEYFYRYSAKKNDGIKKYYIIDENTSDYKRLVKDGYKPVKTRSLMHRLVFLNSDIVFITNSTAFSFNGYGVDRSRYIRGLCNFPTVCLQHGLSVQKCAIAQQRIFDNTRLYFIASKYEKQNLLHHAYEYEGFDILKLTGIARYDGLKNDDKRQILISPTWRMYNSMPVRLSEGVKRDYNPEFKKTVYYRIYNELIKNKKLISTAEQNGYAIKYLLHPIISSQANDFDTTGPVEVIPSAGNINYEKILTQSSLLVTDYSGIQFDFAYMKKPVVYFHPEELPPHYEDGCFFYESMGFGEICTHTSMLVDTLCAYMQNNCVMDEKYKNRVDDFFAYSDHNNCERIYKEVIKHQEIIDRDKMRTTQKNISSK